MRVLVTGGSGLVGYRLVTGLADEHEVSYTFYNNDVVSDGATGYQLDVRQNASTMGVMIDSDADIVVHTAAMTDVDHCECAPEQARAINIEGTRNVVEACEEIDAAMVLFSTAFVFDGEKGSYRPGDEPSPVNVYGETKLAAEQVVREAPIDEIVVRTDQPYGWSQGWQTPTMVEWVLDNLETGEPFEVFEDWSNCPTYLEDIVALTDALLDSRPTGTFHWVGPDFLSRFAWARTIAESFGYDPTSILSSRSANAGLPAQRPNVNLSIGASKAAFDVSPRPVRESLEMMRRNRRR